MCADSNHGGRALQARLAYPWPTCMARKKVESNHRLLHRPPLAGEVAPTGHIFQSGK